MNGTIITIIIKKCHHRRHNIVLCQSAHIGAISVFLLLFHIISLRMKIIVVFTPWTISFILAKFQCQHSWKISIVVERLSLASSRCRSRRLLTGIDKDIRSALQIARHVETASIIRQNICNTSLKSKPLIRAGNTVANVSPIPSWIWSFSESRYRIVRKMIVWYAKALAPSRCSWFAKLSSEKIFRPALLGIPIHCGCQLSHFPVLAAAPNCWRSRAYPRVIYLMRCRSHSVVSGIRQWSWECRRQLENIQFQSSYRYFVYASLFAAFYCNMFRHIIITSVGVNLPLT